MARYESLNGNHDDDEEVQDQHRHIVHDGDEEVEDQRRHTGSSGSSKSSYTVVGQDDEEGGNAGSRAVYAALYGAGVGSLPSGGPVHTSSDDQQNSDHHHQQTIHPALQNPGPFVDAPLIPPKSPARSTSNNPFFNATTTSTTTSTSSQQPQQKTQGSTRSSHSRFGSGSSFGSSKFGGDQHQQQQQSQSRTAKSRSTSRDSSNYVNQYSRSWKPQFGVPQSRSTHTTHAFPPLPETEEAAHRDHGQDHEDYHDHDHDSSGDEHDHHDLDQDDYMYEKETGGMSTPRAGRSRKGTVTGSVRGKNGGGGKGGMRKLMLVERTDTKRGRTTGRGRRGTVMSEVSIDAADSISVRGLPIHSGAVGGGGGFGGQGLTTTTITAGGSNGVNMSEQHLSYFHFESTDTLVQSKQSMLGWWLEGLGVLGGLVCVVVAGLVLSMYDHKPPPSTWPAPLSLNVFLSFMTTLATACYMIPVIEGLGQLRWLRYTGGRRTVSRPASDFEAIDQASRGGIHHSWKLLGFQGGPLGLLAFLITILTLFTPALTQLVISYSAPQPHHNSFGEPFDSHASPVSLVKINWPWIWFLLAQILLSAIFLTAIIVQTRMEGIQIFKTSALPSMMVLDGQARVSLGGITGNTNGGIMTNKMMGERAKKTWLKMERSNGGAGQGNHGLVQGFVVDLTHSTSNSNTTESSKSAGRKGLGLGLGFERFRHHHDHHSASPSPSPSSSYEKEFGGGEGFEGRSHKNLNFPAAAAAAAGFTPLPPVLTPMPIATTVPVSTAAKPGRRKMIRLSLFGGGAGAGREKMRVGGLPIHAS